MRKTILPALLLSIAACSAPPADQKDSLAASAASDSVSRVDSTGASGIPAAGPKDSVAGAGRIIGRDSAIKFNPAKRPPFPPARDTTRPPGTPR